MHLLTTFFIMRQIYTLAYYCALPLIILRTLWRTRKNKDHIRRLGERLGFVQFNERCSIWLHAVSYGEAIAAEPLIKNLKLTYPDQAIVITTMTLTGAIRVETTWKTDARIHHFYLPYDIPFAIKRFLKRVKPRIGIIMETELWPNLLDMAGKQNLPLLLANARLSERSFKGYLKIARLISPLLKNITQIAAQSEEDQTRFVQLGAREEQTCTLGNLKFDITPPLTLIDQGTEMKTKLSFEPIIVAASTHPNEEEQLLTVFSKIKESHPRALLVLVPRHPERFDEVSQLCLKKGFAIARRSRNELPNNTQSVFIGDTMGEMYLYYALADIAFVGGSLIPLGGHNLLEPAALKLPIVTGPHLFNFKIISALLIETGSLHVASNYEGLLPIFSQLIEDKAYAVKVGQAGFEVLARNRGATDKHIHLIKSLIAN